MKRRLLKRIAEAICIEYKQKGYQALAELIYPVLLDIEHDNRVFQVEIVALEIEDDYVNISVDISSGWLSSYFPVFASVVVYKDER